LLEARRASAIEEQSARLWTDVFPDKPIPGNLVVALRDEVSAAAERAEFLGVYAGNLSALDVLTEISRRVPPDLDVVFEELSIDKQMIRMRVQAKSFEAADRLGVELAKFTPFAQARIGAIETDKKTGTKRFNVTISLAAAGMLLFALLWFGIVMPVVATGTRIGARADGAEQMHVVITRLRRDYDDVAKRLTAVEQRIRTESRGNLRTTLETLASTASVKVESMEPQSSPSNDRFRETKVEVGLSGVTLPQTVNYLHQIESAPQVLSVKSLRIRTRPDAPELLNVTFTVSSFEPL
jgi:hypothetical protein